MFWATSLEKGKTVDLASTAGGHEDTSDLLHVSAASLMNPKDEKRVYVHITNAQGSFTVCSV